MRRVLAALTLTLTLPVLAPAADWPQFLGPARDGVSTEKVPVWSSPPKVEWKAPLGDAHSSPVVAGGTVFAFYQPKGKNEDALAAFDAVSGEKRWEKSYPRDKFDPPFGQGPRGTPAVDAGKVYTLGGTGVLACWDAKTGEIDWKVDTLKEFKAKNLFFGVSTSPTVVGNLVVVMVGAKGAGIVAFDKTTGKTAWQATDDPASYASPLTVGTKGAEQLVFLTGNNVRTLTPDGKEVWSFPFKDRLNESSTTPVKTGDLYIASSVTAGSVALSVSGEPAKVTTVWKDPTLTCYFSTPVAVGPHLYMVNGAATLTSPTITLRCVESATGKVLWSKSNVGKYHAAIVRTGDDKLLTLDDTGHLLLLQPDPTGYKELARAKVCGPTWAHPALSNGRVYVRDNKELVCVKVGE
ncbi:PQQ-like beta-propeller repeat protein [Fimbriiglobus ruber]|uniref:Alcohol dehydrogenase n=1 Tax=Fimbriiglobus ruber TaxID=1908690 RepID=A0A225DAN5_9BACT|nr:PQQ-like beta-propeller repeat protein [Fimbriiglobus ruber]OWK35608.1 alcohol dehydrogenase [Fimbriiglobus ruber]